MLDSPRLGIELIAAINHLFPGKIDFEKLRPMIGAAETMAALQAGRDPSELARGWDPGLASFLQIRRRYLQY